MAVRLNCPLFFSRSILLFDIVVREETLKNVIRSVTRNGKSILLTALFALILVYLFSIAGFLYLREVCWFESWKFLFFPAAQNVFHRIQRWPF
jgi:hypothetical protein